jgi:hypothetical protein
VPRTGATKVKNNYQGNIVDPRFFRKYLDIMNERVVIGPDGKPQPGVQLTGPEPTDAEMDAAEEQQRAALGLPSLKDQQEADYQRQLKAYRSGLNPRRFTPRPGDEIKK